MRLRHVLATVSAALPLVFAACSSNVAVGGGGDAAQGSDSGEVGDSADLWDGLMPCNGAGCDAGPHNGDAGLCTTDSDCRNGYVCLYETHTKCSLMMGQCVTPNTMDCTGGMPACDCNGETFEIPCWWASFTSPRAVAYLGTCEAGADSGDDSGDASPE
jgi:hypothetical protein